MDRAPTRRLGITRRDARVLAVTAVLAIGAPVAISVWTRTRTDLLEAELTAAGGVEARIGRVDADLTGTVRLSEVALGTLVAAESLEAAVGLESLLDGELRADEIRVAGPRVDLEVRRDGDSDLAALARRLLSTPRASRSNGARRLRRIVVSSGSLSARIAGLGVVAARGVEIVPDGDRVRLVTGLVTFHGENDRLVLDARFERSAGELSLRDMTFARALAVAGQMVVRVGNRSLEVADVAAGRLSAEGPLELRGLVDDAGIARELAIEVTSSRAAVRGTSVPLRALAGLAPRGLVLDDARVSGSVEVSVADDKLAVSIDGTVASARIDHRVVAPTPLAVDGALGMTVEVASGAVTVPRLAFRTGAIDLAASGSIRRDDPLRGELAITLAPAPCQDLIASMPAALRQPLDGIVLRGTLGARAKLTVDLSAPVGDAAAVELHTIGACETLAEPPAADVTTLADRPDDPSWVDLDRLPRHVKGAFVSAEDGRFWDHDGFDTRQIGRSLEINLREGRLARGGSTISQQLIKNAFLTHRRSLDRKLQEAILTWRLEARLDKKQILERYLNIIELGPRTHGLRAAAGHWFGLSPKELNARQAAFLAALTSEPTTMARRVRRHGGLDPASAERVATVLRAMRRDGVLDDAAYHDALDDGMHFAGSALRAAN